MMSEQPPPHRIGIGVLSFALRVGMVASVDF